MYTTYEGYDLFKYLFDMYSKTVKWIQFYTYIQMFVWLFHPTKDFFYDKRRWALGRSRRGGGIPAGGEIQWIWEDDDNIKPGSGGHKFRGPNQLGNY